MASSITVTVVDPNVNNESTLNCYYNLNEHELIETECCDFRTQSKKINNNDAFLEVISRPFNSKHDSLAILELEQSEVKETDNFKKYYKKFDDINGVSCLFKIEIETNKIDIKGKLKEEEKEDIRDFLTKSELEITHKIETLRLGFRWIVVVEFENDERINQETLEKLREDLYSYITNESKLPELLKNETKVTIYNTYLKKTKLKSFSELVDDINSISEQNEPSKLLQIKLLSIADFVSRYDIKYSLNKRKQLNKEESKKNYKKEKQVESKRTKQIDEIETNEKISDNCKTILLLGEWGVGKSTFINAVFNYIQFSSLDEAESSDKIENPINAKFTFYDVTGMKEIKMGDKNDKNEKFIEGQSSTQTARAYAVPSTNLRVIDTPGMGDTRGIEVDRENFRETVEFISKYKYLDCICFLIKPNNIRFGHGFKYCFKELFSNLSKSSTKNIVFCFTNTRSTMYRPGDTLEPLKNFIEEVNATFKVDVPISYENMFCLDNEAFRYLMLVKSGIKLSSVERKEYLQSWKHSSSESRRLIEYVNKLDSMKTSDIVALNNFKFTMMEWAKDAMKCIRKLEYEVISIETELNELNNVRTNESKNTAETPLNQIPANGPKATPQSNRGTTKGDGVAEGDAKGTPQSNRGTIKRDGAAEGGAKGTPQSNRGTIKRDGAAEGGAKGTPQSNRGTIKRDGAAEGGAKGTPQSNRGTIKRDGAAEGGAKGTPQSNRGTIKRDGAAEGGAKGTPQSNRGTIKRDGAAEGGAKGTPQSNRGTIKRDGAAEGGAKGTPQSNRGTIKRDGAAVGTASGSKDAISAPRNVISSNNGISDIRKETIDKSNKSVLKLRSKIDEIIDQCSKLSSYIFGNSVAIFNDFFESHIDEAIKEEENKEYIQKQNSKLLEKFRDIKAMYIKKRKSAKIHTKQELGNIRNELFRNIEMSIEEIVNS